MSPSLKKQSFFRIDVLVARMNYRARSVDRPQHRLYESTQFNVVPSAQFRFPLFTGRSLKGHIGGGFKTPIHFDEAVNLDVGKITRSNTHFPWVAITLGGLVDLQIGKHLEWGLSTYQAPSVELTHCQEPIHYYSWIAYRF